MHIPFAASDCGIDTPMVCIKELQEVFFECRLKLRQVHQETGLFHSDCLALRIDPRARHQTMDVRVELHLLPPCVKDGGKAVDLRFEAFGPGKLFAQRAAARSNRSA